MSRWRNFVWIGGSLIGIVILISWRFAFVTSNDFHPRQERPMSNPTAKYIPVSPASSTPEVSQISLKEQTKEQAMQAWWARREHDKKADWKVPVRFYGRVVDQNMEPVTGATIHFQWTDLSKQGTAEADTVSDAHGNFSLSGA